MHHVTEVSGPTRWKPGQSGNPNGLPLGSRQAFSAGFLKDLAEVWAEHGRDTMVSTAKLNPAVFFATCAWLIPGDVKLTVEQTYGGLTPEDYAILQAIKPALPNANSRSPTDVLQHTLDAIRRANANVIEIPAETADPQTEGVVRENA